MMNSVKTRKNAGFTLVELMVSMGVTLVLLGAAVAAFRSAQQTNEMVTEGSDLSENLRAGMNMMQLDIQQAGTGIPTGGIPIPFTSPCGTTARINRPVLGGKSTFPYPGATCESSIPAVEPGNELGPAITAPDAISGTPANPNSITDEITVLYADNSVGLDSLPVNQPPTASPANAGCPNGKMQYTGTTLTVTFDVNCINLTNATSGNSVITINPGDLIAFQNANGTALLWVTNVSGQTLTFQSGDPFDLNGRTDSAGTIRQLETGGAACGGIPSCFPPTLATRIWMITYYLDNVTAPPYTRLIRQVNMNPPTPVGETLENLQFTYNFVDGITNPANQSTVPAGNSESNIRSVNVYLAARASQPVQVGNSMIYARSNLMSQVCLRSLAYVNNYTGPNTTVGN
jgi:prepilin-type N-terminal cleavage/methylation domain-containing protein